MIYVTWDTDVVFIWPSLIIGTSSDGFPFIELAWLIFCIGIGDPE
jgi:hypothetical protein